jgi:hypothetical protein
MARHVSGPRRSESPDSYLRGIRVAAALALLALVGAIVSDALAGSFWSDHPVLAGLLSSVIVVMLTVALVNEALERRSRQRWSVLAQYVMLQLVGEARVVWAGFAELAGLMPVREHAALSDVREAAASIEKGSRAVRDTAGLTAALREVLGDAAKRRQLREKAALFVQHSDEVLGRWAAVMLNSDLYAEVMDRHVELAGDLAWLDSLLAFEFSEGGARMRPGRSHPAALVTGSLDDDQLAQRVAAITQLAEQLDRMTLDLALRIVPFDWWRQQLGASAPTPLGDRDPLAPEPSRS